METITKAGQTIRELSKTEVQIAVAQITDRLVKEVSLITSLDKFIERDDKGIACSDTPTQSDSDKLESMWNDVVNLEKAKHDIDDDVASSIVELHGEHVRKHEVPFIKRIIPWWVNGELSQDEADYLFFYFDAWHELDFGWVFLDRSSYYYSDKITSEERDEIVKEFISIGTRSNKKHSGPKVWCVLQSAFGSDEIDFGKEIKKQTVKLQNEIGHFPVTA